MASKPLQLMRPSVWGRLSPLLRAFNILRLLSLPTVAKWLVYLVFLINARSWPLMWHSRFFSYPTETLRVNYRFPEQTVFSSPFSRFSWRIDWCYCVRSSNLRKPGPKLLSDGLIPSHKSAPILLSTPSIITLGPVSRSRFLLIFR